jgi:hypothetical protein
MGVAMGHLHCVAIACRHRKRGVTDAVTRYAEAAYALIVAGAAYIWPPLALLCAAAYLIALAVITDRRTPPPEATP